MGIASSSNIANVVSDVSNSIISSASSTNSNFQSCYNSQKWNNCTVKGTLKIKNICDIQAKAYSIVSQNNTGSLNSTVSQKLLQQAQSAVGSMGIGYASATNIVSALVKNSNLISNNLVNASNDVMNIFNQFTCNNSSYGNVDITNDSTASWITNQVTTQQNISKLVSSVSQDITQSASATVQGLAAFLIALAILIVAIGYVIFKPVGMILNTKIIVVTFIFLVLSAIILFLYLRQLPPFFNEPLQCTATTSSSCCGTTGLGGCVDFQDSQNTDITSPPLRYTFDILGVDGTMPGSDPNGSPGLLQMLIVNAGGWNANAYNYFENSDITQKYGLENPLSQNGMIYVTNVNGWLFDSTNGGDNKKLYARFVLCNLLTIDTSTYIFDDEACMVGGVLISPPDQSRGCLRFTPTVMPMPSVMDRGLNGGGTVTGTFGACNNPSYRLQTFMKKGGFIIPIVLVVGLGAFLIFYNTRNQNANNTKNS